MEQLPKANALLVLAHLSHAIFHLLALAGITPQVQVCCLTQCPLTPDFSDPNYRVGFDVTAGGTISLSALESLQPKGERRQGSSVEQREKTKKGMVAEATGTSYQTIVHRQETPVLSTRLNATELTLLQQLAGAELTQINTFLPDQMASWETSWLFVERILRQYAQYHFGRPIRSATLIDSYFAAMQTSFINHDATV